MFDRTIDDRTMNRNLCFLSSCHHNRPVIIRSKVQLAGMKKRLCVVVHHRCQTSVPLALSVQVLRFGPTGLSKSAWGHAPGFQGTNAFCPERATQTHYRGTMSGFVFSRNINLRRRSSAFADSLAPG